jgi:hypothetical protein
MIRPAPFLLSTFLVLAALVAATPVHAQSRNAAFLDPSSSSSGKPGDSKGSNAASLVADPAQTDAGETLVNVARRVTVFFYNGFRSPTTLTQLMVNADGNVRSKVLSDDCKSIRTLPAGDRCSIVVEVVPSSPGPWSVELLLNHSGQGRITRAEIMGTTLGKTDEKSEGLAVSKKIAAALDFGDVRAGEETAARTMLIENDSPEPLHISSIDLISGDEAGLRLRTSGCKEGEELKAGESCPITLIWEPRGRGNIATDLIVRHSGNLGFVVIPIRGNGQMDADDEGEKSAGSSGSSSGGTKSNFFASSGGQKVATVPSLPTVSPPSNSVITGQSPPSIEQIAKSLPTISANNLKQANNQAAANSAVQVLPQVRLMGIVNGRVILGDSLGGTHVIGLGETATIEDQLVEVMQVDSTRAVVKIAGVRKELALSQTPSVVRQQKSGSGSSGIGGSSSNSSSSGRPDDEAPLATVSNPVNQPNSAPLPAQTPPAGM